MIKQRYLNQSQSSSLQATFLIVLLFGLETNKKYHFKCSCRERMNLKNSSADLDLLLNILQNECSRVGLAVFSLQTD